MFSESSLHILQAEIVEILSLSLVVQIAFLPFSCKQLYLQTAYIFKYLVLHLYQGKYTELKELFYCDLTCTCIAFSKNKFVEIENLA